LGATIFYPYFCPNFGLGEPKFFGPLEVQETHSGFEFQDPNPNNGAWGEIKKFHFSTRGAYFKSVDRPQC